MTGAAAEADNRSASQSAKHQDWSRTLEWIESQGMESLRARFTTAEILSREAQTTLTVLLAGIGGSAAYAAKVFESSSPGPLPVAFGITCVYLVALSVYLVCRCMLFTSYPALSQEPKNLMHPEYSLDDIRRAELENLDQRIKEATTLNRKRAVHLNAARLGTALTPAIFIAAAIYAPSAPPEKQVKTLITCTQTGSLATPVLKCELLKP